MKDFLVRKSSASFSLPDGQYLTYLFIQVKSVSSEKMGCYSADCESVSMAADQITQFI